jgi:aryl-alcohol dehydrogenase-like predicted oxidoreductase
MWICILFIDLIMILPEKTMETLDSLVRAGKVLNPGVSACMVISFILCRLWLKKGDGQNL